MLVTYTIIAADRGLQVLTRMYTAGTPIVRWPCGSTKKESCPQLYSACLIDAIIILGVILAWVSLFLLAVVLPGFVFMNFFAWVFYSLWQISENPDRASTAVLFT